MFTSGAESLRAIIVVATFCMLAACGKITEATKEWRRPRCGRWGREL